MRDRAYVEGKTAARKETEARLRELEKVTAEFWAMLPVLTGRIEEVVAKLLEVTGRSPHAVQWTKATHVQYLGRLNAAVEATRGPGSASG
ncbi:MAG: hypothetical protein ACREN1_08600 [Candidatus Dormibacteria bacterium]